MKCTVLVDNLACGSLCGEWGLSIYIEYGGKRFLLDTGASGLFAENAKHLGIDLSGVDYGILSHAHYDHADGMEAFFAQNEKACLYLRRGSRENCYSKKEGVQEYVGIRPGLLSRFSDRLCYTGERTELMHGVTLLAHSTPNLHILGMKANMFTLEEGEFVPETFAHEQSLIFETAQGLVIFNSCSHAGADNIIREAAAAFPNQSIYALIGGFHLFRSSPAEVHALAERMKATGIRRIVTGHCTGDEGFAILKEHFGDRAQQMHSGLVLTLEELSS